MDVAQRKNITLTVIAAILFMIVVLALFFNKMTTPRYLSDIELKINGLILLKPRLMFNDDIGETRWMLLTHNDQQAMAATNLLISLPRKISIDTISKKNELIIDGVNQDSIWVVNPDKEIIAYFKPPFDTNKMKLTYSSVFAHR